MCVTNKDVGRRIAHAANPSSDLSKFQVYGNIVPRSKGSLPHFARIGSPKTGTILRPGDDRSGSGGKARSGYMFSVLPPTADIRQQCRRPRNCLRPHSRVGGVSMDAIQAPTCVCRYHATAFEPAACARRANERCIVNGMFRDRRLART